MRYGINLLLWTDVLHDGMAPIVENIKGMGYDAVEIPVLDLNPPVYTDWGKRLDGMGLERTGVTVRGGAANPMSADAAVRQAGIDENKLAIDCAKEAGCSVLAGPFHSALGEFSGTGATEDEWKRAVESMREVAEHADQAGVTLSLEYLNRFECYLITSAEQLARFCKDVGHPRCKAMYDTFHSHIEEKSVPDAIRAVAPILAHVHISENDRSTPGSGNVRWAETFDALKETGYDGLLMVEAFSIALEKLRPATKIWRRMYESEDQLAADALKFMKAEVRKRW